MIDRVAAEKPAPELLSGLAAYGERAREMVAGARNEICLLSQQLDRRLYPGAEFAEALQGFVRQHARTRVRILLHTPADARVNSPRIVEVGRALSSFIEFRELLPERRIAVLEEYLIADARTLLWREDRRSLESRQDYDPLAAKLKLKDFDTLWNESPSAQELRRLGL